MSRRPKALTPAASPLHFFGAEVRRLRLGLGLSHRTLAEQVLHGQDLVRKVEVAERIPSHTFVERCDDALGAGGNLLRMWPMLEWERHSRSARCMGDGNAPDVTDRHVLDWLLAAHSSPRAVMSARPSGSLGTALDQLRRADRRVGAGRTYPQLTPYLIASSDDHAGDAPSLAAQFFELAGYEAVDLGADALAQTHYLRALDLTVAAGDRVHGGYLIAVSLGHLALHRGHPGDALRLVHAAIRGTEHCVTPALKATFHAVRARAHARLGDHQACIAALHELDADFDRSRLADEPEWVRYFGEADIADEKAHCFFDLGHDDLAQREASAAIGSLGPSRLRRLALDTALLASAHARSGDVDEACTVGRKAVEHARGLSSFRSAHRVMLMMAQLQARADEPAVRELSEYVGATLPRAPTLSQAEGSAG